MKTLKRIIQSVYGLHVALCAIGVSLAAPLPAWGDEYAQAVLSDNPVGYWRFEESDASLNAKNSAVTGEALDGACHNVTLGMPGATAALGQAGGFTGDAGSPSYVDLGSAPSLKPKGDFTLEWWQNMTSGPAEDRGIIAWTRGDDNADESLPCAVVLHYSEDQLKNDNPRPQFALEFADGAGASEQIVSRTFAQPDRWYHVVIVCDAEARTIQYYVNGLPAGEAQAYNAEHPLAQADEAAGLTLGRLGHRQGHVFQGCLDEMAVYDHTLSDERIMAHYRAALEGSQMSRRPLVVAHRGVNRFAPENTRVSYEQALAAGAPIVELDLHRSKDGVIVLLHDDTLERTTNGTGRVNDLTLTELKALDAGSWKDAKYAGEPIPTLQEVAELCKGKAIIMLDLKDPVHGDEIAEVMSRVGLGSDQVIVAPWHNEQAADLTPYLPGVPMILLHGKPQEAYTGGDAYFEDMKQMGFTGFSLQWAHLPQAFVTAAHRHGMKVYTWTLNEPEDLSGAALMGVDGVITDDSAGTAAYLDKVFE